MAEAPPTATPSVPSPAPGSPPDLSTGPPVLGTGPETGSGGGAGRLPGEGDTLVLGGALPTPLGHPGLTGSVFAGRVGFLQGDLCCMALTIFPGGGDRSQLAEGLGSASVWEDARASAPDLGAAQGTPTLPGALPPPEFSGFGVTAHLRQGRRPPGGARGHGKEGRWAARLALTGS